MARWVVRWPEIVAIVDVYDARVHNRVNKGAMTEEEAIDLMKPIVSFQIDAEIDKLFADNFSAICTIHSAVPDSFALLSIVAIFGESRK